MKGAPAGGSARTNYHAYQEMPYEGCAHGDTHPARIWAVATLRGLDPPDPRAARVLEIGCARGGNLIPMAARLPEARFVGLDLSDRQLADAEAMRAALGLDNVELRAGDVVDFDDPEPFDYIIAHGVYSWIPADARAAIRRLCGRHLTPRGLAYISHNVNPGWQRRQAMRDMMLYHVRDIGAAPERVEAAREVLRFVAAASTPADHAYKLWLHEEYDSLTRSTDDYVFHEHLAVHNAPSYLHEFAAEFAREGLHFVGDGYLPANFGRLLPEDLARDLTDLVRGDPIAFEQYQDFVLNRAFRKSLLARKPPATDRVYPERWLGAHALSPCHRGDGPRTWRHGSHVMRDVHPATDALLDRLAAAWPGTLPVAELFERHVADGLDPTASGRSVEAFCHDLFLLAMNEVIEVTPIATAAPPPRERPRVHPWVIAELDAGLRRVTTLHHKTAAPPPAARLLARLADGTRDRAALIEGLREAVDDGRLPLPIEDPTAEEIDEGLAQGVERGLMQLRHFGLLG